MNQENKISVIVPVYNTSQWLTRCVSSICGQTYENLEILLVDDGSTDGSGELAEELAGRDHRIKVFHKENGGSSSARNWGLDRAEGRYIGFIDSDDYIEAAMYQRLMAAIRQSGRQMAQISRDEISEDGSVRPDVCIPPEKEAVQDSTKFIRELLMHRGDASFCTKLTESSLFGQERFPEGVLNEDFHLLVRLLQKVNGVAVLPEQYYHVCYRSGSNTRTVRKDEFSRVFMDIVDNADMMEELVARRYPMLVKEAERFALFQRLDYLLHIPISRMVGEDEFYRNVVKYLRRHVRNIVSNAYLSRKERIYLLLLAAAPKGVRQVHAFIKNKG